MDSGNSHRTVFLSFLLLACVVPRAWAATYHVSPTGSDSSPGTEEAPWCTIQYSIEAVSDQDVIVAHEGIYYETIDFMGKAITLTSEDPDDPAVVAATVINGGKNGYAVVTFANAEGPDSVLTGFTITNGGGAGDWQEPPLLHGGGICCYFSSPTITGNVITHNEPAYGYYDAGGIYCGGGNPVITGNRIVDNSASSFGAGIFCEGGAPLITGNTIEGNVAGDSGGGIHCYQSSPTITGNNINYNEAAGAGGGIYCEKGAPLITGNDIGGNSASAGGGICCREGAPLITDNRIGGNSAGDGGGIGCSGSAAIVRNNRINGNTARYNGGGVSGGTGPIEGNVITNNYAWDGRGGGIYAGSGDIIGNIVCDNGSLSGAGITCWGVSPNIVNNTIANNNAIYATTVGGIYVRNGAPTIRNCIIRNCARPTDIDQVDYRFSNSSPAMVINVSCSDIGPGQIDDETTVAWGDGMIDVDPLFAGGADYHLRSTTGRWDPAANGGNGGWVTDTQHSPCIDAGDSVSDFSNEPYPNGGCVNMGAYGNTVYASKSLMPPQVATPAFDPAPGTYALSVDVTITCATDGSQIRYTADGADPTASSTLYTSPVHIAAPTMLKAVAFKTDMADSAVASGAYDILVAIPAPEFSPLPGTFNSAVDVAITCSEPAAAVHYTTDGTAPTSASPTYANRLHLAVTTTLRAVATYPCLPDSPETSGIYRIDASAPAVSALAAIPSQVREGLDSQITLTATGDDSSSGGSDIVAAEYFIGSDPGQGLAAAMAAADASFDSPVEALTATVDTLSWTATGFRRINVRARDAAGNWTAPVAYLDVPVIDGTAPSPPSDFSAVPGPGLTKMASWAWNTSGTLLQDQEETTIDLGAAKKVGAVGMQVNPPPLCFPTDFSMEGSENGSDWESLVRVVSFRPVIGAHLWQCRLSELRYVRVRAWSLKNKSDGRYYVRVPEVSVYESSGTNSVTVTWCATADDGNDSSSGKASVYDLRYSGSPITEANWVSSVEVPDEPAPGIKGALESCTFSAGNLTTAYVALKIGDETPNWSSLVAAGPVSPVVSAFASIAPDDFCALGPSDAAPIFEFRHDLEAGPCFISFSGCAGFPQRPVIGDDGELCGTLRVLLRSGVDAWTPSLSQWKAIKRLVHASGLLFWRLEGSCPSYGSTYGPSRTIIFNCGEITDLHVSPSHITDGEEAVWPDKDVRPAFSWTDQTNGMAYCLIDVSKDKIIALSDKQNTITLGGRGISGTTYLLDTAEWKRVRRLATSLKTPAKPDSADGVLYWRVRVLTADGTLSCVSVVKTLIVDRGEWALDTPVDNADGTWTFRWTHVGEGVARYALEVCWNDEFSPAAKETVKVPTRLLTGTSYTLTVGDMRSLKRFMARHNVSALHWRVRGEDGDRRCVCYSDENPVPWAPW